VYNWCGIDQEVTGHSASRRPTRSRRARRSVTTARVDPTTRNKNAGAAKTVRKKEGTSAVFTAPSKASENVVQSQSVRLRIPHNAGSIDDPQGPQGISHAGLLLTRVSSGETDFRGESSQGRKRKLPVEPNTQLTDDESGPNTRKDSTPGSPKDRYDRFHTAHFPRASNSNRHGDPLVPGYGPGARRPHQWQEGRAEAVTTEVSAGINQPTVLAAIVGRGVDVLTLTQAPFVQTAYSGIEPATRAHMNFLPVTQAVINSPGQAGMPTHRPTGNHTTRSQPATVSAFGQVIEKRVGLAPLEPSAGTTGTADRTASTVFGHTQKLEHLFRRPHATSGASVVSNEAANVLRWSATARDFAMAQSEDFDHAMGREESSVADSKSREAELEESVATLFDHDSNRTNHQDVCDSRPGGIAMVIDWGQNSQDGCMGMPNHKSSSGGGNTAGEEGFVAHGEHEHSGLRQRLDDWGREDPEIQYSDFFNMEFELWLDAHQ
jgi:hypothetical protein